MISCLMNSMIFLVMIISDLVPLLIGKRMHLLLFRDTLLDILTIYHLIVLRLSICSIVLIRAVGPVVIFDYIFVTFVKRDLDTPVTSHLITYT